MIIGVVAAAVAYAVIADRAGRAAITAAAALVVAFGVLLRMPAIVTALLVGALVGTLAIRSRWTSARRHQRRP